MRWARAMTPALKRSRCPICRTAPEVIGQAHQLGPLLHRRRDGLLHQHVRCRGRSKGAATSRWAVVGTTTLTASTASAKADGIREDGAPRLGGDLGGPQGIGIHHPHQFHIGHP